MGVGTSLFLIAIGAILDFAVHPTTNTTGIDINTVGLILMIVGIIGLLFSLAYWNSWGGFGGMTRRSGPVASRRRRTYVEDAPAASPRAYVADQPVVAAPRVRTVVQEDDVA
jgi:hypothetical protein